MADAYLKVKDNGAAGLAVVRESVADAQKTLGSGKAPVIYETFSGVPVVTVQDGADGMPVRDFVIGIEPVQSGSGDPGPDNIRPISGWTGANVWNDPKYGGTVTWNQLAHNFAPRSETLGVTITVDNTAGSITATGTPTATNNLWFFNSSPTTLKNGHVYLMRGAKPNNKGCYLSFTAASGSQPGRDEGNGTIYKANGTGAITYQYTFGFENNKAVNVTWYPQFFDLTQMFGADVADYVYSLETATPGVGTAWFRDLFPKEYYPYNAGAEKTVSEVNGDPYDVYSVSWQTEAGTVYGGTLDVTAGLLTVTHGMIASYNGEDLPGEWISDRDVYASGTSPSAGAQVVYELETPQTYNLSPVQVLTVLGENNIWADTGGVVSLDCPADTKLYIEQLTKPAEDDMTADANIASGKFFMVGNRLFLSTAAIANGAAIIPGTNCTEISLADALNSINS